MTPQERRRLADEGYAPALGGAEPAVVAFTTAVAAAAVNELLDRLIGYGPRPRPSETLLRWHEREISINTAAPRPGHYCDPHSGKMGWGAGRRFSNKYGQANENPLVEVVAVSGMALRGDGQFG